MVKVTLINASSLDYWPLHKLTLPNKVEYCLTQNIQLVAPIHTGGFAPNSWGERNLWTLETLNSYDTEWVWMLGTDTLITNMTIDIRRYCDPQYDVVVGMDINGLNNDSMLYQNTQRTRDYLKRVLCKRDSPHDQDAMNHVIGDCKINKVSQKLFNAYKYDEYRYKPFPEGTWEPGDFVIHFPGMNNDRRIKLITKYLEKVVR